MNLLVFAAHPDDAETCAGGLIARTVARGGTATIAVACDPHERAAAAEAAADLLGAKLILLGWDDDRFPPERTTISAVDDIASGCDVIVTHRPVDSHQEHRACAEIAQAVARRNRTDLWLMNHSIPGGLHPGLETAPNLFVDVTDDYPTKGEALDRYECQDEWRRAIEARDRYFGEMCGVRYAEAFTTVHQLLR